MNKLVNIATMIFLVSIGVSVNAETLTLKVYNASASSFHVNSTLIYGESEAVVIDAGFTKADALRIAANVLDSGKILTTIFVSQADPDYYFGVETLKQHFPQVKVLTTSAVHQLIKKKAAGKLAYWGPKMGGNAPNSTVLPDILSASSFLVDGHKIELKGTEGIFAHRPYLWIPSEKAIVGNIGVFGNTHVWTADTKSPAQLSAWIAQLKEMQLLNPNIVVPGHMKQNTTLDAMNISYTATYLNEFIKAKSHSENSKALIESMKVLYPTAELPIALDIGAKVHMGEMQW